MANDERMTKPEIRIAICVRAADAFRHSSFGIPSSFVIRASSFCLVLAVLMLLFNLPCRAQSGGVLTWKSSTASAPWVDKSPVALTGTVPLPTSTLAFRIFINSSQSYQAIDGWGGCFNERGWKAMLTLSGTARNAVMRALFDPQTGLKLNYGRTPIGSNDYSI